VYYVDECISKLRQKQVQMYHDFQSKTKNAIRNLYRELERVKTNFATKLSVEQLGSTINSHWEEHHKQFNTNLRQEILSAFEKISENFSKAIERIELSESKLQMKIPHSREV